MAENKQLIDRLVQDIHALYSVDPKSSEVRSSSPIAKLSPVP